MVDTLSEPPPQRHALTVRRPRQWRTFRAAQVLPISGSSNIDMTGGVYEGVTPGSTKTYGTGASPHIKVTGGSVTTFVTMIGQGLGTPNPSEGGLLEVSGDEVTLLGANFYGRILGTVPAISHKGGRLAAFGTVKAAERGRVLDPAPTRRHDRHGRVWHGQLPLPDQSLTTVSPT